MHMQEQFGHVTVTYDEETALLQQPRPEDLLVEQLLEEGFDCKRAQAPSFPVLYHLSQLRGIWRRQRTADGGTCKEGRESHLSGGKCESVQTVGKTVADSG